MSYRLSEQKTKANLFYQFCQSFSQSVEQGGRRRMMIPEIQGLAILDMHEEDLRYELVHLISYWRFELITS